jgi:hypothetical protein
MKIWIFNVLVAGALAYLFLGESEQTRVKSDLEWAKDKVETTIENNRSGENGAAPRADVRQQSVRQQPAPREAVNHQDALTENRSVTKSAPVKQTKTAEPSPQPPEPKPEITTEQRIKTVDVAPKRIVETGSSRTEKTLRPIVTTELLEAPRAVVPAERASGNSTAMLDETAATVGARPQESAREVRPPLDDPEVARRRAVVLDIDEDTPVAGASTDTTVSTTVSEHVTAMAARERFDALNALAVDMELMFIDKTSR